MFRFTRKPLSGSHSQYLTKITRLVQCWCRRSADVVSAMCTTHTPHRSFYASI